MGRPKVPLDQKIVTRSVRLPPEVDDAVCRYALRHEISVYALLGRVVTRVFAKQVYSTHAAIVYREVQPSSVVAARRSSGVTGAGPG